MRIIELLKEMSDKKVATGGTADRILETWSVDGHGVALVEYDTHTGSTSKHLTCECEYDDIPAGTMRRDECRARRTVRQSILAKTLAAHQDAWMTKMGLKKAVLDIHQRAVNGEFLGYSDSSSPPNVVETARLIGLDVISILDTCIELDDEEKIELYYLNIHPYKPRFRLPKQLRMLIRRLLARTRGTYESDQAVRFGLENLEILLQNAKLVSGRQIFPADYPDLRPEILEALAALCLKEAARLKKAQAPAKSL